MVAQKNKSEEQTIVHVIKVNYAVVIKFVTWRIFESYLK